MMNHRFVDRLGKVFLAATLVLLGSFAQAQQALDAEMLDDWLATTEDFMPMQDVFEKLSTESSISEEYTEEQFRALDEGKQDELIDEVLREQSAYDHVYAVLNEYDWDSAGEYMRVSSRLGMAIAARMREQMMQNLPEEQRQMVAEMSGKINARPEDMALVSDNWDKVSSFVQQNMGQQQMPMGQ